MGPLTWGQRRGFQSRGELPTEHQEAQHGADRGTGEFAPSPVFGRRFVPDKVRDRGAPARLSNPRGLVPKQAVRNRRAMRTY